MAFPRTLIFCTTFTYDEQGWETRYRRWLDAVLASGLGFDQILMVDDGSEFLPDWPDVMVETEETIPEPELLTYDDPILLYHFGKDLGRSAVYDFPGWWRSFSFAARYAEARGFDKVIHIESDAYLISRRIRRYAMFLSEGWTAFWCPKYNVPEICIQIIAGKEIANFAAFFRQPYEDFIGIIHELMIPYTRVVRHFIGDRYGEEPGEIPRNADYATQVPSDRSPSYYWWLNSAATTDRPRAAETEQAPARSALERPAAGRELVIEFGAGENSDRYTGRGWAEPEDLLRWMVEMESELRLPPLPPASAYQLVMWLVPNVEGARLPRQRLRIELNAVALADLEITTQTELRLVILGGLVAGFAENRLRFVHPDAASPASLSRWDDDRELAIAVGKIEIRRHLSEADVVALQPTSVENGAADIEPTILQAGAHVAQLGDLWSAPGDWIGQRGEGLGIEGLMISPGPDIAPDDLEYSVLPGGSEFSAWVKGGEFCGSRGAGAPVCGLRVRILGDCAANYRCSLSAAFTDGSVVGPVEGADLVCRAPTDAPMEAFRIGLRPLALSAMPPPDATPPATGDAVAETAIGAAPVQGPDLPQPVFALPAIGGEWPYYNWHVPDFSVQRPNPTNSPAPEKTGTAQPKVIGMTGSWTL